MMDINIAKIKIKPFAVTEFSFDQPLDAVAYDFTDLRLVENVVVSGSLTNRGGDMYAADFTFRTTVELTCSRCGQTFTREMAGQAEALFMRDPREGDADEASVWPLDGDKCDLAPAMLNEIYFALPMQPLCREDCAGLCPHCGIDLNHHSCSCAQENIDPRWEKLRDFLPNKA